MPLDLPPALQAFIDATNSGDSAAFVQAFASDAYLNDWGREFHGSTGIASWNSTDNIGVHAHVELLGVDAGEAGAYNLTMLVSGDGFNGTSTFAFEVAHGKIRRLVLS